MNETNKNHEREDQTELSEAVMQARIEEFLGL